MAHPKRVLEVASTKSSIQMKENRILKLKLEERRAKAERSLGADPELNSELISPDAAISPHPAAGSPEAQREEPEDALSAQAEPGPSTQVEEAEAERRDSPRFDKAFPVFVSGDRGISYGVARNVSEGGMYVELLESAPLGSVVTVTFAWPGSNAEMSVEAQVRYATALNFGGASDRPMAAVCGVGLRFVRFLTQDLYDSVARDPAALH